MNLVVWILSIIVFLMIIDSWIKNRKINALKDSLKETNDKLNETRAVVQKHGKLLKNL